MAASSASPSTDALLLGCAFPNVAQTGDKTTASGARRVETCYREDGKTLLTLSGDAPVMTIAPTNSDKVSTVIIPNLLHYAGPVVVVDPRGEYYKATAEARRQMGHNIVRLDPFGVVGEPSGSLNPLDLVRLNSPTLERDCQDVARLVCDPLDFEDPRRNAAFGLLSGVIGYIMAVPEKRKFSDIIDVFGADDVVYSLAKALEAIGKQLPVMSYREISTFLQGADLERSKILLEVTNQLKPFMSKEVQDNLGNSSFSFGDLLEGKPVSFYLMTPPSMLKDYAVVLRLWIATLLRLILRRRKPASPRTLFILDECAQCKTLPLLESAATLCHGQGVQVWTFWQDLAQIRHCYPESWSTLIGQCGAVQVFGRRDYAAAAEIEALLGISSEDVFLLRSDEQILCLDNGPTKTKKWNRDFR